MKQYSILTILILGSALFSFNTLVAQPGPPRPLTFRHNLTYNSDKTLDLQFDLYQGNIKSAKQPVVFWISNKTIKTLPGDKLSSPGKFPVPISFYIGYGYTVVSLEVSDSRSKDKNIGEAIKFLTSKTEEWHLDMSNLAYIDHTADNEYSVIVIQKENKNKSSARLTVQVDSDSGIYQLINSENTAKIIGFLHQQLNGGEYNSSFNPLQLPDPDTAWVDPIMAAPAIASYHLYPTPARGEGKYGSFMIYLPTEYSTGNKRYPVIYFLHGGNGNQRQGQWLMEKIDKEINDGKMAPTIVVSVQGLPIGWYCNANTDDPGVISGPIEDVIIKNLIPYIDSNFRTIANQKARGIEGWSMGGYGAIRLSFKYPDLFGFASSLAGAVINWEDEHNPQYLTNTFGTNQGAEAEKSIAFFNSVHPKVYAKQNSAIIIKNIKIRIIVGDQDWLFNNHGNYITKNFSDLLTDLGIKNDYFVIKGVGHMLPDEFASGKAEYPIQFWVDAFKEYR